MHYNRDLGCVCHWCGAFVGTKGGLRTGNHVYCDNGGRCKQAHYRAFHKYKARVTSGAAAEPGHVAAGGPGGNAAGSRRHSTSSPDIAANRAKCGNKRRRHG